jgi:hypothetical protein
MAHYGHAEQTVARAEHGYATVLGFFSKAKGLLPGIQRELQSKFKELRERLNRLQRLGERRMAVGEILLRLTAKNFRCSCGYQIPCHQVAICLANAIRL